MTQHLVESIAHPPVPPQTLVNLLQTFNQPNSPQYLFLNQGREPDRLTYQELDRRARAIAVHLTTLAQPGDRVLLLYPPGLDYIAAFFGCLYAGIIAVPAYPPKRNRSGERLQAIAQDAEAVAVLTTAAVCGTIQREEALPKIPVSHWITTEAIDLAQAEEWQSPLITPDTLAFLQYTSGSTGTPKGVMVSHGNLMQNLRLIHHAFGTSSESFGVSWLPPYHDMGLIGGILGPLYAGCSTVLMSPVDFLRQPFSWLQAISDYGATTSGGPNFAYDLCAQKITAEQKATLDLSRWTVAFNGAEPVRAETLERFTSAFAECGFQPEAFYPCYGMAESTLFITGGNPGERVRVTSVDAIALTQNRAVAASDPAAETQTFVGCGHPWLETRVVIVDPERLTLCEEGAVGEIWTTSSSIAQGYWNKPEISQQTFQAAIANTEAGPFLRTGDLGFLQSGELFVTGRLKDVIIIRGCNHYPQDIERTVEQTHPAIRQPNCCAAFTVELDGQERLVVVAEVERRYRQRRHNDAEGSSNTALDRRQGEVEGAGFAVPSDAFDAEGAAAQIRQAIAQQHGLQVYAIAFLKVGSLPKTSSGKIQRYACRAGFLSNMLEVVAESRLAIGSAHSGEIRNTEISTVAHPVSEVPPTDPTQTQADDLIHWLRDYGATRINSYVIDERRCIPPYVVLDFGNKGLLGMQVPQSYGGLGLSHTSTLRILEQLGAIDPSLALFTGLNNVLGIRPILRYGSEALKAELLPTLATGRELAAFAITEPSAGSNPQAIASRAIPTADGRWSLHGTKIWSGSAAWAGVLNVFVQQQDSQGKACGVSGFAVRQGSAGLRQGPEALTMGMRGMVQNTVFLEGVPVEAGQMLGAPGTGMTVAQDAMSYGRLSIAAACIGGMKRCAQLMTRYADRRPIATGRLLDNPVTLLRLSDLTAAIATVEALVGAIATRLDAGLSVPVEAYTVCKTAAPEFFWQATDHLVQLLGGRGYIETNIAPQLLRDARILRIFEGPTETLNLFLGSRVMHDADLRDFLAEFGASEIAERLKSAAEQLHQRYSDGGAFGDRITALRQASGLIGELATWAVLWAVSRARSQENSEFQRGATWAQMHFEQKLEELKSPAEAVLLQANALTQITANYQGAIGEVEQTLAGADYELDTLLRKNLETVETRFNTDFSTHDAPLIHSEAGDNQNAVQIQLWMQTWIAQRMGVAVEAISSERSPIDYGLDSVTAQEFIRELETELNYPTNLDSNLIWQFPTIASLSQHLATVHLNPTADPSTLDLQAEIVLDPAIQPRSPIHRTDVPQNVSTHPPIHRTDVPQNVSTHPPFDPLRAAPIHPVPERVEGSTHPPFDPLRAAPIHPVPERVEGSTPFLTGATGFLGAFLLKELLEQTTATVYCLVRAADAPRGLCRIQKNLESYGLWSSEWGDRIIPVLGDLSQPQLGLSEAEFQQLSETVDMIYHSAAFLNWVYPYPALKQSNVLGTQEVIRLACLGRTKPLHYVSTTAVFESSAYAGKTVDETTPLLHSEGIHLGYSQSKWVAERLVTLAQERGLPVTIYRPPLISGHSTTGAWNTDDFTCRMIQGCLQLGAMAELDYRMDLAPVDYVSRAIAHLARQPDSVNRVFHLNNAQPIQWNDFIQQVQAAGYPVEVVSYEDWLERLQNAPDNALAPLLPFFLKRWSTAQLTLPQLYQQSQKPEILSQQTQTALAQAVLQNECSDCALTCPPVDSALLHTYFAYLRQKGLLPDPPIAAEPTSESVLHDWMRSQVAEQLHMPAAAIDLDKPLSYYGLDSIQLTSLLANLEEYAGGAIAPELLEEAPSIRDLSQRLEVCIPLTAEADLPVAEPAPWLRSSTQQLLRHWFQLRCHGLEHLPMEQPFLLAANHQSHLDTGIVLAALEDRIDRLNVLAAKDYFFDDALKVKMLQHWVNLIPVDRLDPHSTFLTTLHHCQKNLAPRHPILIFPEGTRSPNGQLQPFQSGLGLLALRLHVPIIPVWISGTHQVLPKGNWFPRRHPVQIRFGEAINPKAIAGEGGDRRVCEAITQEVRRAIENLGNR